VNGLFSSRELAAGIWLGLIFILAAATTRGRISIAGVARAALHWKMLSVVGLTGAYTAIMAWLLWMAAWTQDLLKDTVVWFLFSGLALIGSVMTGADENRWQRAVLDQVKVVILIEYLLATTPSPSVGN